MQRLFIGSMSEFSGKSLVCIGIGLAAQKKGLNVGYIKPLGRDPVKQGRRVVDADALVAKEALGLKEDVGDLSPYVLGYEEINRALAGKTDMRNAVAERVRAVKGKDLVLIEGMATIFDGSIVNAGGMEVVRGAGAKALLVEAWKGDDTVNRILFAADVFGARYAGAVINRVSNDEAGYVKKTIGKFLEKRGIRVYGVVGKDAVLSSVTVRELAAVTRAKILCCEEGLGTRVERYLVGAMDVNSAMKYFRRTPNKAVITGGHRADIQLAALETSTACLILTGGFMTNDVIIAKAASLGVPVMAVDMDTFSAIEKIESILGKTHLKGGDQVKRAAALIREGVNVSALLKSLDAVRTRTGSRR